MAYRILSEIRGWHWICVVACGLLLGVVGFRSVVVQGYLLPVRIAGHSMAPTFYGDHALHRCDACGIALRLDASGSDEIELACHNCCYPLTSAPQGEFIKADRVVIDKITLRLRPPRRWDVVALKDPEDAKRLVVKRILGLPGERLEFQEGTLLVDGRIPTRSQASELPIMHHEQYRRRGFGAWRPQGSSCWEQNSGGFDIEESHDSGEIHWLAYEHQNCSPVMQPGVIYDDYVFNSSVSRTLHPAATVRLRGRARLRGNGSLLIRCESVAGSSAMQTSGVGTSIAQTPAAETWVGAWDLGDAGTELGRVEPDVRNRLLATELHFQVTVNRFHIRVRMNGESLLHERLRPMPGGLTRFSIGAAAVGVQLDDLVVSKEHGVPLDSPRPATANQWLLGEDEYMLVGDNAVVSIDSRHWSRKIRRSDLLGIVRRY